MKEELNIDVFIYNTMKATAVVAGQRGRKPKQMKKYSGGSCGKSDCAIKYISSVALYRKLCESLRIKKAICRIRRCLEQAMEIRKIFYMCWKI